MPKFFIFLGWFFLLLILMYLISIVLWWLPDGIAGSLAVLVLIGWALKLARES